MAWIEQAQASREDGEIDGDAVTDDFFLAEDALLEHDYCKEGAVCSIFIRVRTTSSLVSRYGNAQASCLRASS